MTGLHETSELQGVDFALGAHIAGALEGYNPNSGPKGWRDLISRPVSQQIFRSDVDTPAEFMRGVAGAQKHVAQTERGTTLNSALLPCIYYYRKPGLANVDGNHNVMRKTVFMETTDHKIKVIGTTVSIDYRLVMCAWDKPTLDKMMLAWSFWIMRKGVFNVNFRLSTDVFPVPAQISDHFTITLSDVSIPGDQGRLFAVETALTVAVEVFMGTEIVLPEPIRLVGVLGGFLQGGGFVRS